MKNSLVSFFSFDNLPRVLWAMALLTIPVTSFRWFPFLDEGTKVRPMALYPLVLLVPLLLLQWRRKKIDLYWGGAFVALGALILFIFASSSFGILIDAIPMRGQNYLGRTIRALLTLCIGLVFFICAVWMNRDEKDFRFTLRWLLAGLSIDLAWSILQAITFYTGLLQKQMVTHWQLAFSMRELVRTNRISGLAYEPAWLAGQLATIYLPWLFAAVLTNFRLTRVKWLEPVLLGLSLIMLLATYSRGGLLITIAAAGLIFLFFGRTLIRSTWNWFIGGFRGRFFDISLRVGMIAILVGAAGGALFFLGRKNYFNRLWQINAGSLSQYIININAGARGAYTVGALAGFEEHPWSGVGFGASGFYIYRNLPDWSLTIVPEIAKQLSPDNRLYPNPKNLYIRLLAETGLIGFFLFLAFQFYILGDVLSLLRIKEAWARFAAIAGVFAWFGITFYNSTQDSLAMPTTWIVPGILVGLTATTFSKDAK